MKSKRVLTILLSMAIMLTFMPMMAFADADTGHVWKKDEAKSKAATCAEFGYTFYNCDADGCNITKGEDNEKVSHSYGGYSRYTKVEYLSAVIAEGKLSVTQLQDLETALTNTCYLYARTCKMCGQLESHKAGNSVVYDYDNDSTVHTAPSGTPDCAESYACDVCGQTVYRTTTHDWADWETTAVNVCPKNNSTDPTQVDGIEVQTRTCKKCNKVETRALTTVAYNWYGIENHPAGTVLAVVTTGPRPNRVSQDWIDAYIRNHCEHDVTPANPQPTGQARADYVWFGAYGEGAYFAPNKEVQAATCTATGTKVLECPVCHMILGEDTVTVPKLKHNWTDKVSPATCTAQAFTVQICADCGAYGTVTMGEKALGHDYKVTVVSEPNCEFDGLTMISCSRCGEYRKAGDSNANIETKDKVNYFKGFDGKLYDPSKANPFENCIVIADWAHGAHKWGPFEDYQAASCLAPQTQARKCSVCGSFDAHGKVKQIGVALGHEVKEEVVPATCGEGGYTYKVCARCNEYLDKDGKTAAEKGLEKPYAVPQKYNETKSVKAPGTKCTYEWQVLEEATAFKLGTRAKVCTECGHMEEATKESIAKTKIAAPKVKAGKKKATVTVKAVEGAVKYQIKVNGKVKKTITSAKKVTIKKLKGGKKAKFQIVAFNAEGVKATSGTKSVKIKK